MNHQKNHCRLYYILKLQTVVVFICFLEFFEDNHALLLKDELFNEDHRKNKAQLKVPMDILFYSDSTWCQSHFKMSAQPNGWAQCFGFWRLYDGHQPSHPVVEHWEAHSKAQ